MDLKTNTMNSQAMKTLDKKEFTALKQFISTNEIDPRFLNYGGFVYKLKPESYKKSYRDEIIKYAGMYRIFTDSNLYQFDKDNGRDFLLTEKQKNEILPIIEQRKKTPQYIDTFNTLYNCYGYEYTIYSDNFESFKWANEWYITEKPSKLIHLDASEETDENLKNEVLKECTERIAFLKNKGFEVLGFEVRKKYCLGNFTKSEFNYIVDEIVKHYKGINQNNHPTHQITRRTKKDIQHRIKDFKEYVLEPTKRKVLLEVNAYGLTYVEIERINDLNV